MKYGIVSDIHANIQAWEAVLRDMKKQGVESILCLGDVIGYGPNPAEVLESCYENVDYFILGNHDAVVGDRLDSNLFNDSAKYLIDWTREQLNDSAVKFFNEMPLRMQGDGFACAHAELALPGRFGYIYKPDDALDSFLKTEDQFLFVGHTHHPARFIFNPASGLLKSEEVKDFKTSGRERYLVNAGSVGDPRDGNTTASYVVFDSEKGSITYRQVPFDIETFRQNLKNVKLPVTPFFLKMFDGRMKDSETIKDMKVMEANQAVETSGPQKIEAGVDVKTRRIELTFSPVELRRATKVKAEKKERTTPPKKRKKNDTRVAVVMLLLFLCVGIGGILLILKDDINKDAEQGSTEEKRSTDKKIVVTGNSGDWEDLNFEDFEAGAYSSGWLTEGDTFESGPLSSDTTPSFITVKGIEGRHVAVSVNQSAQTKSRGRILKGVLLSPAFNVNRKYICMLVQGSGESDTQYFLRIKGEEVETVNAPGVKKLKAVHMDVSEYMGREVQLGFRDSGNSFIAVDKIVFSNNPEIKQVYSGSINGKRSPEVSANTEIFRSAGTKFLMKDVKGAVEILNDLKTDKLPDKLFPEVNGEIIRNPAVYLAPFIDFEKAILNTFESEKGSEVSLISKATTKAVFVKISYEDSTPFYAVGKSSQPLTMAVLSDREINKRAKRLPFGKEALMYYKLGTFPDKRQLGNSTILGRIINSARKALVSGKK